ncbi:MAG: cytochrome c maturation protein CcmE [Gammaproteobacteria bacterium]|nr:MAG: cytochrome c maturation protein CcmE [Gammaproteobacteria bacterium]
MKPARRRRLQLVIFIVSVASIGVGLAVYALRENINLFYTPSQLMTSDVPLGTRIRVGGMVVADSLSRNQQSLDVTFEVTDGAAQVPIHYSGILPDLFAENEAAVAIGHWTSDNIFMAEEVMAKHDEEYTPPEVADAMEQAYQQKLRSGEALQDKPGRE